MEKNNQINMKNISMKNKKLRCQRFLNEMNLAMPWARICLQIQPFYQSSHFGRPKYPLELMFKIYCLQQWYSLSDPAIEEAIYDRNSFQEFLGFDFFGGDVPDETSIMRFRHLLEKHRLADKIFAEINLFLAEQGKIVERGTIVDATLINAPKSIKNKDKKRNPEMSSTCKNNQWYFGLKQHIGVQAEGKPLVHSETTTTAKKHDKTELKNLVHGKEKYVCGDKAYGSKADKKEARKNGISYGIQVKASRNKTLTKSQKRHNKQWSKIRSKVEHVFGIVKNLWGQTKARYRTLDKNNQQFVMLCGLANIFMVRKELCLQESCV